VYPKWSREPGGWTGSDSDESIAARALGGVEIDHHFACQRVQAALEFVVGERRRHGQQRLHPESVTVVGGIDDFRVQLLDADAAVRKTA